MGIQNQTHPYTSLRVPTTSQSSRVAWKVSTTTVSQGNQKATTVSSPSKVHVTTTGSAGKMVLSGTAERSTPFGLGGFVSCGSAHADLATLLKITQRQKDGTTTNNTPSVHGPIFGVCLEAKLNDSIQSGAEPEVQFDKTLRDARELESSAVKAEEEERSKLPEAVRPVPNQEIPNQAVPKKSNNHTQQSSVRKEQHPRTALRVQKASEGTATSWTVSTTTVSGGNQRAVTVSTPRGIQINTKGAGQELSFVGMIAPQNGLGLQGRVSSGSAKVDLATIASSAKDSTESLAALSPLFAVSIAPKQSETSSGTGSSVVSVTQPQEPPTNQPSNENFTKPRDTNASRNIAEQSTRSPPEHMPKAVPAKESTVGRPNPIHSNPPTPVASVATIRSESPPASQPPKSPTSPTISSFSGSEPSRELELYQSAGRVDVLGCEFVEDMSHVVYLIAVFNGSTREVLWTLRRRFSEFESFVKILGHPEVAKHLPPKNWSIWPSAARKLEIGQGRVNLLSNLLRELKKQNLLSFPTVMAFLDVPTS